MPNRSDRGPLDVQIVSVPVARKVTTIRLDENMRDRLREIADQQGVSEAEIIRQAIVFYLGFLHGQSARTTKRPDRKGRGASSDGPAR